jgi:hypothetical protein
MKIVSTISAMAVITVILLLIYAAVQQTYRTNANDPQMQMARDIALHLKEGESTGPIFPADSIDISKSLSVFAVLYDNNLKSLKSSGFLHGNIPQPPAGVFDFARSHGEDAITWQPEPGVRMAMVLASVQSPNVSFVAVGRSLKEVEVREGNLLSMVIISWLICVGIIAINIIAQTWRNKIRLKNAH